jgi:peptide chain release factor 1
VPPTERGGRVHTSSVTVACITSKGHSFRGVSEEDLSWETFRSGGPGGQNQNKVESGCRVTHTPTGLTASARTKSQAQNRKLALQNLLSRIASAQEGKREEELSSLRRKQIGSGMRGDKIRTYRVRDNYVTDHLTGKTTTVTALERGDFSGLK